MPTKPLASKEDLRKALDQYPPILIKKLKWFHGHGSIREWIWSEDCKCYRFEHSYHEVPAEYCLEDRYIHADYGLDSYGVIWQGSYSENWHGGPQFGYDLKSAIEWLHEANYQDLGPFLWSGEQI